MRKLELALILLSLLGFAPAQAQGIIGPPNQILCNKTAFATVVTATTTSLIAGIAGQTIYLCGWHVTSTIATTTTFQFEQGTQGGPCSTPTVTSPPFNVTSTAPSADNGTYAKSNLSPGAQYCVVTVGGSIGMAIMVWFSQF